MGSTAQSFLFTMLVIGASITAFVLLLKYVIVPLFRGIGTGIGLTFRGIGWFFAHIFEFIGGVFSDIMRFIGALLAMLVLMLLVPLNIVIGRWSAAGHFAEGVKRECHVASACVYRAVIRRPLKLVLMHGVLEGLEQRVPEAMLAAPTADAPPRRSGGAKQFDGYAIVGSLRAGGSGAKLYIAEPLAEKRTRVRNMPEQVVIKSFAISEGSSLPQIVRESRALECAKQLGHVLDHGMDEHRFYYVMPYHPGDHLGILARQMHGECGPRGLDHKRLNLVMSYTRDLLTTLSAYHKGGLWHKDVKPENVIVHDGQAHLVDLGLVTPLKSAMTLTTHGTEYFRDPEMVRQALRGVKVHQVNGAKFDIYAVGAVLYFMIENTFPAHGGLSRFAAKSPEALRWIVRRAMTEYHQRYTTADEMLKDVHFVLSAADAFAVKPAELPSMRGEGTHLADLAEAESIAMAATPKLRDAKDANDDGSVSGWGVAAGMGAAGAFAQVGEFNLDADGNPLPRQAKGESARPPRLTVTNWWTGEYRVDDGDAAAGLTPAELRKAEFKFRDEVAHISAQAKAGVMSARKAAREQIKAARRRAQEMRTRAVARRHRVVGRPRTPLSVIAIGLLSLLFLGGILLFSLENRAERRLTLAESDAGFTGRPLLLAIDSSKPLSSSARRQVKQLIEEYTDRGYSIIEHAEEQVKPMLADLRQWSGDPRSQAHRNIEQALANADAYGVLYVPVEIRKSGQQRIEDRKFIASMVPGADNRGRVAAVPPAPANVQPYLIINDHPAKFDLAVSAEIERQLRAYRHQGWPVLNNEDLEVRVRPMVIGDISRDTPVWWMLHSSLAEASLGGVLRIDGKAGSEPASQRVSILRIDRETNVAIPSPPDGAIAPAASPEARATVRSSQQLASVPH